MPKYQVNKEKNNPDNSAHHQEDIIGLKKLEH